MLSSLQLHISLVVVIIYAHTLLNSRNTYISIFHKSQFLSQFSINEKKEKNICQDFFHFEQNREKINPTFELKKNCYRRKHDGFN